MNSIILKAGGSILTSPTMNHILIREAASVPTSQLAIVHGGGKTIDRLFSRFGYTPEFQDGVRVTSEQEMPLVDMALAGTVNTAIVRALCANDKKAIGLTGSDARLITASPLFPDSHTGRARTCHPSLLTDLWSCGYLPVIAPVCNDEEGRALNVNADEVADIIARTLENAALVFITDVPGILHGNTLVEDINLSEGQRMMDQKIVSNGMMIKLQSACASIRAGVAAVHIASLQNQGDLQKILNRQRGTCIHE